MTMNRPTFARKKTKTGSLDFEKKNTQPRQTVSASSSMVGNPYAPSSDSSVAPPKRVYSDEYVTEYITRFCKIPNDTIKAQLADYEDQKKKGFGLN